MRILVPALALLFLLWTAPVAAQVIDEDFEGEAGLPAGWILVDNHPGPSDPAFSLVSGHDGTGGSAGQAGHIGDFIDGLGGAGQAAGGWFQAPGTVDEFLSWELTFDFKIGNPSEDITDDAIVGFGDLDGRNFYALVLNEKDTNNELYYYNNDERAGPNPSGTAVVNTAAFAPALVDNTWYSGTLSWDAISLTLSFDLKESASAMSIGGFTTVLNGSQVVGDPMTSQLETVNPTPTGQQQFGFGTLNDNGTFDNILLYSFTDKWIASGGGNWNDTGNWSGGTVPNAADAQVLFNGGIDSPATVTVDADVTAHSIHFDNSSESFSLQGDGVHTLTLAGDAVINVSAGSHTIAAPLAVGSSVTKSGAGTLILDGAQNYTGTTNVAAGRLLVNGVYTGGGAYTVAAGATLGGGGEIQAPVTVNGRLAPGSAPNSPGLLSIDGDLTLTSTSVMAMEIGGAMPGTGYDRVDVQGTVAFDGRLDLPVIFIDGYVPAPGEVLTILTATEVTGDFTSVFSDNLGSLNPLVALEIVQTSKEVQLHFVEPRTDIQFDADTETADWASASTWDTGIVPGTANVIEIENLTGTAQRVDVQTQNAFVHQLVVNSSTDTITVGVKNGRNLSAFSGATVGDQATIELDNGNIVSLKVAVEGGGSLTGNGTVVGQLEVGMTGSGEAVLSPGFSVGHLDVEGDYHQGASGTLALDVEGDGSGQFDTIDVTGDVELAGTLQIDASALGSFTPGMTVEILTADSVTGIFQNVETVGGNGIYFAPFYSQAGGGSAEGGGAAAAAGGGSVQMGGYYVGDMNRDTLLDENDVPAFALALTDSVAYFSQYYVSGEYSGDIDGFSGLDFDDIDDFAALISGSGVRATIESILAAIDALQHPVPEPASGMLILWGSCLILAGYICRRV